MKYNQNLSIQFPLQKQKIDPCQDFCKVDDELTVFQDSEEPSIFEDLRDKFVPFVNGDEWARPLAYRVVRYLR